MRIKQAIEKREKDQKERTQWDEVEVKSRRQLPDKMS